MHHLRDAALLIVTIVDVEASAALACTRASDISRLLKKHYICQHVMLKHMLMITS